MLDLFAPFFQRLYETTGVNFTPFYDPYDWGRLLEGMWVSVKLILAVIAVSMVIGVVGAGAQTSKLRIVRFLVAAYIEIFRNTPPIVQLLFFYFGLGAITPRVDMGGWYEPIIGSFGWAVIALGIFGGSYNVEIFRSGVDAVPETTKEAADALGFSDFKIFAYITLPLAFRFSLPALTNNVISLAKTSSLAYVIAVPEITYTLSNIWSDSVNVPEMMVLLFLYYIVLVAVIAWLMGWLERKLALPGYGQ
ncbi:polar amino acid transport system permease protein [Rhodobium orientis]|uniref:Polar amino acid ABC transporter permease n=1 Tax=Rhodobium orientis TaxID=34017 RepID=A0A327JW60_9HYPH|nr:amino acid ABC transporter permease [Rhodobium orientis]MBB4302780.1 polar amino acid transport system permease protein [Rhodobium orientis]MBK5948560.1 polar amino acid ABC transporter permease [Rhodobium orientis]RAI29826.1 polar amino acid ABC transporter permease [Rhodobium orientis]